MAGISYHLRLIVCFVMIFCVRDSRADVGIKDFLSMLARDLYQNLPLGVSNNDDTIIQERQAKEMSLMQEIKSGRHGHGGAVHIYGRHNSGPARSARGPSEHHRHNIIDV